MSCCYSLWLYLCWNFVPTVWLSRVWVLIVLWRDWESCTLHCSSNEFALPLVVPSLSFVCVLSFLSCKFGCTSFWLNYHSPWYGIIGYQLFVMFCFEFFVLVLSRVLYFDPKLLVYTLFLKLFHLVLWLPSHYFPYQSVHYLCVLKLMLGVGCHWTYRLILRVM